MKTFFTYSIPIGILSILAGLFLGGQSYSALLMLVLTLIVSSAFLVIRKGFQLEQAQKFMTYFWMSLLIKMFGCIGSFGIYSWFSGDKSMTTVSIFFISYVLLSLALMAGVNDLKKSAVKSNEPQ